MSYLVFCSFEVGAIPFKIAEILNRSGHLTYYISVDRNASGHDSDKFHYTNVNRNWNLTPEVIDSIDDVKLLNKLKHIKLKYNITHCFATGHKSFLLAKAGIKYCYWSFGSDLDQVCFYESVPSELSIFNKMLYFTSLSNISRALYIRKWRIDQIKSIQNSEKIMISPYQYYDYLRVCSGKEMFFLPHMFSSVDYADVIKSKIENRNRVKAEIGTDRFFFSSTRHIWSGANRFYSDNKGNDVMIRAFAQYLDSSSDLDTKLVLIEKGADVDKSRELIKYLAIENRVIWIGEMKRDDLFKYYSAAIVVFGQFGTPVLANSALEPLTQATPCISYFDDGRKNNIPFYENTPSVYNSCDENIISQFLVNIMSDNSYYDEVCYDSWLWINNNCNEDLFSKKFIAELSVTGITDDNSGAKCQ